MEKKKPTEFRGIDSTFLTVKKNHSNAVAFSTQCRIHLLHSAFIKILSRIHSTELLLNRKKEKQVFLLNFQEYHSVRREKCMKIEM